MPLIEGLTSLLVAQFLFFPSKRLNFSPSQFQLNAEEVRFQNGSGQPLHGLFFPGPRDRTLLFFHGNAGNIGDRLDKIRVLKKIGWNIFIFDYRGYGGSEGFPTIDGIIEDSEAALRYLTGIRKIPNEEILLFGESLGGAPASRLGSREPFGGLILESTFTSLRDMAKSVYPFVPAAAVPDAYRSLDHLRTIKSPLLVMHGTADEIIPFEMGKKLFEAAPHPKRFYPVRGAHHNDVYLIGGSNYLRQIEEFLAETGPP